MKIIRSVTQQTLFDVALQTFGSIEGLFELVKANPSLSLDADIPALTEINDPGIVINKAVKDHYSVNNLKPATGKGEELIIVPVTIHQALNYDLSEAGYVEFDSVELPGFLGTLDIDINIEGTIEEDTLQFTVLRQNGEGTVSESIILLTGTNHMTLSGFMASRAACNLFVNSSQEATLREIVYYYEKYI